MLVEGHDLFLRVLIHSAEQSALDDLCRLGTVLVDFGSLKVDLSHTTNTIKTSGPTSSEGAINPDILPG